MRKHSATLFCEVMSDLKASAGHTFSRIGRASRAEKLLRATASKNVLGQILERPQDKLAFAITLREWTKETGALKGRPICSSGVSTSYVERIARRRCGKNFASFVRISSTPLAPASQALDADRNGVTDVGDPL